MENWTAIRQDVLVHGLSQRAACEKYQLGWHTLKKILSHAEPPGYRQKQARPRRVLAPVLPIIHEILDSDQKAPKKQRHTAKRIFERLKAEYGYLAGRRSLRMRCEPGGRRTRKCSCRWFIRRDANARLSRVAPRSVEWRRRGLFRNPETRGASPQSRLARHEAGIFGRRG
jgi:transposase